VSQLSVPHPIQNQRDLCEPARKQSRRGGEILFPGQTISHRYPAEIGKDELDKARDGYYHLNYYGCLDYLSTLDTQHHQTGFILKIAPLHLTGPKNLFAFHKASGDMPASELTVVALLSGYRAD
jgi:hypothetical protein